MLSEYKRTQKPGCQFSKFSRTFIELSKFKLKLALRHEYFSNDYANSLKSSITPWEYLYATNEY